MDPASVTLTQEVVDSVKVFQEVPVLETQIMVVLEAVAVEVPAALAKPMHHQREEEMVEMEEHQTSLVLM